MAEQTQEYQFPVAGEHQARLKPFVGEFRSKVQLWMGPGEPHVSTGTMHNQLILNDLYLEQVYQGDSQEGPFPNFQGRGFWGYNFVNECYEGFWIDSVSNQMQLEHGQVDESGKVWTMLSEITCPMSGPMKKRSVITLIDDDHHTLEMFSAGEDGNENRNMLIEYERVG